VRRSSSKVSPQNYDTWLRPTKLLRKVRDRHDTRPEDLTALSEGIAEAWPKLDMTAGAVRSMAIVREELRRLGAEEEA
jgi:hypothetical protein